ncbi:MAG: xanthine dehydrogenase [Hyphomicrobiales bacterium]|nr:xanthine dehydrogenase [Hyphomicrobiales bacterium]
MTIHSGAQPGPGSHAPWIGRPLPRFEDLRLVQGAGRYSDDVSVPGQAYAIFVRSPHAHAQIRSIDVSAAAALPGVVAVLTGADYVASGGLSIPVMPVPAGALDVDDPAFKPTQERAIFATPQWPLALDRVRFPGEAVAMVIAETLAEARDAAEAVAVDYEALPALTSAVAAAEPGAPLIWPDARDNVAFENAFGDHAAAQAALAGAHLVVEQEYLNPRMLAAFMEPRAALAEVDPETGRVTLTSGCQGVHRIRMGVCGALTLKTEDIRVICPDTGGGFGSRNDPYPEQICAVWAAMRLKRPVKWTNDRTESLLTDYQGRDITTRARLGFDAEGRIVGLALDIIGGVGAQTLSFVQLHNTYRIAPTVYRVPCASLRIRGVITNTTPTGPFRGAGRPEATLAMERSMDIAAQKLGIDRLELRRRNLVTRKELPYATASGLTYDSGDFHANMRAVLKAADWKGFERRRKDAARRGKLAGIGLANYVECPVGAPHERVDLRVNASDETIELVIGTQSTGQGHETSFAQVVADMFGVDPGQVRLVAGDTDKVVSGGGSHSDRSMRIGSALMAEASGKIIAQARRIAAHVLDAPEKELVFEDGLFSTRSTNRRLGLFDLARAQDAPDMPPDLRARLAATAAMRGRIPAFPTGAAVCELEVDSDTGLVEITRYTQVDDAGQPINPLILHGQVHGGIVQGVGQALVENHAYDSEGQVISATFMDYAMPRADLVPSFDVQLAEDPTKGNPLRIKGGGEGGTTPAPAAIMNAVCDALSVLGVRHFDMPATPHRVWAAIDAARRSSAGP